MKTKKFQKNAKALNNDSEKPNEVNLFTTLYGENPTLDQIKDINKISKLPKNNQDSNQRSPRRFKNNNPIAPIDINVNNPKVIVPHPKPMKTNSKSNLVKNAKSKLSPELSPRRHFQRSYDDSIQPPTPSTNPRISNDHLTMFDDTTYDDQQFLQNVISRINSKEPVYAKSLFYHQNGQCEWRKCTVVGYNDPRFIIKFDPESSKTKEVPRVALKFDLDDQNRFEKRRNEAYSNRIEVDTQLRLETYLYSRAMKNKEISIEPDVIKSIIRRIGQISSQKSNKRKINLKKGNDANTNMINRLIPEIHDNFLFADALCQFVLEWDDPKASEKFLKSGLERYKLEIKPWKNSPEKLDIANSYFQRIVIPNQFLLQQIVNECIFFINNDFLNSFFKQVHSPIQLSYFFEQLKFEVNAIVSDARINLRTRLTELLRTIIQDMNQNLSEKIELMVNLRYKEVLASIINHVFVETFDLIKKYKITFDISVERDLRTTKPSFETIEEFGIATFESIFNTFENKKIPEIKALKREPEFLSISFDYLNISFENAKKKYLELLSLDMKEFNKTANEILNVTKNIPTNPEEVCKEILSNDFIKDNLTKDDINFDLIREKLNQAKSCYDQFLLTFSDKIELNLCTFDIRSFYQSTIKNYECFYSSIFNKLELIADYQTSRIYNNVKTLHDKSGKTSSSIEEWYEKHCILLEIRSNIHKIEDKLNFVLTIIDFMTDFQYQPQCDYVYVFNIKKQLLNVYSSIRKYNELDYKEKVELIISHRKSIEEFKKELEEFQVELMNFHYLESNESNYPTLLQCKDKFEKIIEKMNLYQCRDSKLELNKTDYEIIECLQSEIDDILNVWTIGHKLVTIVENWLSIPFRYVDIGNVTNKLVEWRNILEKLNKKLTENKASNLIEGDLIIPTIDRYQSRINELIQHLPIITSLCNKHLRGRHWHQINNAISPIHIDVDEGLTWNWLIESGVENHMLAIKAICREADSEYKIESALSEMVEELHSMRLKVNENNGVLRLEDPSFAMVMLSKHQQKLQEIFIPPYVHPFLERIRDYNDLANNLRQILKQTIEAQQKIDELKPAMDSNDIRNQHEEMAVKFDNQVEKFNEFTGSFKLSPFHQIIGNQRYTNISSDLLTNFNEIRENLSSVLEEKRKICPRFRLLSDSQLLFLISNCNKPSVTKKLFSLMYSNIKKILLENENYCIGFIAKSGEQIFFENKIKVTPESIEKWYLQFDNEIKETMKKMTQTVLGQISLNLEKVLTKFPIQIVCLVHETIFTSNVNKQLQTLESSFLDNKQQSFLDFLQNYLTSMNKEISNTSNLYKKTKIKSISSLILTLLIQRDLLSKMIENQVDSSMNPLWYSYIKYFIEDITDFSISVHVGPAFYEYGFEYTGIQRLIIKSSQFNYLFSNFLLSISNSIVPLLCADVELRKTETVIDFASVLGFSPFVFPCYSSTTIEKLKSSIKNARECREILILEGIDQLMPNTLNELSVYTFCEKNKSPIIATYSVLLKNNSKEVPEQLKLYYRPVYLNSINLEKKYKLILESLLIGIESLDYISSRFAYLTQTVSKLFGPPLNTILMENSIIQFFRNHPSISVEELVQSFITHVKSYLVDYDLTEMLEYITCLFSDLKIDFDPLVDYQTSEDLIKTKSNEKEIESGNEFEQNILYTFKSHYGIIVLGRAMTGKTTLVKKVANKMKKKLLFINPFSISMDYLYGDKSSGLLSSLLTENGTDQWIVFDGSCRVDWMEIASYVLINNNRRMTFGDGSTLVLASSFRIIFETDDISMASPLTLGACTTIYISEDRITLSDHLNKFIDVLSYDSKIIEPLSNTIVGSTTPASKLTNIIQSFFDHFVPKTCEFVESLNCRLNVSKISHFVIHFFECFHCNLLNYYVSENKHSSDDLLKDSPNLLLFALVWAFGGCYSNEDRVKISDFLIENSLRYIESINQDLSLPNDVDKVCLFDYYYDEEFHSWKNWTEKESILPNIIEVSPYSIFIPNNSLISVCYLLKNLIKQNSNVLMFCDDANNITPYINLCLNSDYFLSEMSVILYNSFGQINVREILQNFLPDLNVTNGLSIRYPLLTLLGFDITSCDQNSELLRFIMEHKFFRNSQTFVDESVPSLRHLLTTDKKELNPRLSHFCFLLNIEKEDNQIIKNAFACSIEKSWKIDSGFSSFLSDLLIETLNKVQHESPHFDYISLQLIFQRITAIEEQKSSKKITEMISHELLSTFYESIWSENILNIINDSVNRLTNHYNEMNNNNDVITFLPAKKVNVESQEKSLEIDIEAMTKLLKTFRSNFVIKSDSKDIPFKIISEACSINDNEMNLHFKKLEENLLQVYHDCFVDAGLNKRHTVLFIDDTSLRDHELELLNLIMKNNNIFGLFSKGEKMKLMSGIHSKDASSFDEGTIESSKNFNFILSDFLCESEKYCHIVVVSHSQIENLFKNVTVYIPLTKSVKDERLVQLKELLQENLSHLFTDFPYLLSDNNLNSILSKIEERESQIKKKVESIKQRFSILKESKEINDSFLNEYFIKMKDTEIDINKLNEDLKNSMESFQHLQEVSEQQAIAFEKEAEELKVEESKAQVLRKECEVQLAETKAILEDASQEVKHLSSRDTAVIKTMNHPPKGVVLVVIAMCIVMDVDIDYNVQKDDLSTAWTKGKSVMNDPSFLNKLINSALDSLNPAIIQKLEPIVNDSNFEPTIIEKSSSAAKSICIFIRSLIPYYEALKVYKEKNSLMREMEDKLSLLIEKQNEAMQKLTLSKNKCIENQQKNEKITQTKKSYEDQLSNQREKIGFYQKFQESIELYTNEKFEFFTKKIERKTKINDSLFAKEVFKNLCGPFTDTQRNELLNCLNSHDSNQSRESLLCCQNSLVKKWHKLQYPVSQFWKENSSIMAPEGGRWVVAEGLRCCSSSYLKKLLNSPNLPVISVFSSSFENDFIELIQKSNRIIITDYDFKHPSLIVSLAYKSIQNKENSMIYNNIEINFQKDLIVYFDVDFLPSVSFIDFNAVLVNLRVGSAISIEQIALSMFQLKPQFSEIQNNESLIYSKSQEIDEIEREIETILSESRIEIFDSKEIQKRFINLSRERNNLVQELSQLKETHVTLFETFSDSLNDSSEICQFFEKFPIQTSLWRIYENSCQSLPSINNVEAIKSHLTPIILNSLPSKLRMNTILSSHSIFPESFNKDFEKVASIVGSNEMISFQSHQNIIDQTKPNRPVLTVSPSSQFEICSFMNYLQNEDKSNKHKCYVYNCSDDLLTVVKRSIDNGTIVVILLNSIDDLKNSISAISIVLSQSIFNQSFRLFLFVTFPLHHENDIIFKEMFLPNIVTFCDTFYFTEPFNAYSISAQLNQSNKLFSKLATFHSISSIIRKFKFCGKVHEFSSFLLSKKCLLLENEEIESKMIGGIELFISLFVYGEGELCFLDCQKKGERFSNYIGFLSKIWNTRLQVSCELDSPKNFGLCSHDFDFFKERFYFQHRIGKNKKEDKRNDESQDFNKSNEKEVNKAEDDKLNEEEDRKELDQEDDKSIENEETENHGNIENEETENHGNIENEETENHENIENEETENHENIEEEQTENHESIEEEQTENHENIETENQERNGIKNNRTDRNEDLKSEEASEIENRDEEVNKVSFDSFDSTENNDELRDNFQQLIGIDFSSLPEIPRNLSHEFDFVQEQLQLISSGSIKFTHFFHRQVMQVINVPDVYDLSLFVSLKEFFEIIKAEFMKENGFYSKTVLMFEDCSKFYEELQPNGALCKGLVCLNGKFNDGELHQIDGISSIDEFWLKPVSIDSSEDNEDNTNLKPIFLYKDGRTVDSIYIRFNGDSDELEKVVLINDKYV